MRNCHKKLLLRGLAFLLLVAQFSLAQEPPLVNVTGTWLIHSTGWDGKKAEKTIRVTQNGNRITGHFKGPDQSGGLSGFVSGKHISFTTKTRTPLNFHGMVDGDTIEGTWGYHGHTGVWNATRTSPQP